MTNLEPQAQSKRNKQEGLTHFRQIRKKNKTLQIIMKALAMMFLAQTAATVNNNRLFIHKNLCCRVIQRAQKRIFCFKIKEKDSTNPRNNEVNLPFKQFVKKFGNPKILDSETNYIITGELKWIKKGLRYRTYGSSHLPQTKFIQMSDFEFHTLYRKDSFFDKDGVVFGGFAKCKALSVVHISCLMPWMGRIQLSFDKFFDLFARGFGRQKAASRVINLSGPSKRRYFGVGGEARMCKGFDLFTFWNIDGKRWNCWNSFIWDELTAEEAKKVINNKMEGVLDLVAFSRKFGNLRKILKNQPDKRVNNCHFSTRRYISSGYLVWVCRFTSFNRLRPQNFNKKIFPYYLNSKASGRGGKFQRGGAGYKPKFGRFHAYQPNRFIRKTNQNRGKHKNRLNPVFIALLTRSGHTAYLSVQDFNSIFSLMHNIKIENQKEEILKFTQNGFKIVKKKENDEKTEPRSLHSLANPLKFKNPNLLNRKNSRRKRGYLRHKILAEKPKKRLSSRLESYLSQKLLAQAPGVSQRPQGISRELWRSPMFRKGYMAMMRIENQKSKQIAHSRQIAIDVRSYKHRANLRGLSVIKSTQSRLRARSFEPLFDVHAKHSSSDGLTLEQVLNRYAARDPSLIYKNYKGKV